MKKCVVIGSGLGGLSCGVILAKNGYDVTVLEKGHQIGGCLQCFHRGSAKFDTGMHYIGSADNGQVLQIMLKYLGVYSQIELSRLDTKGYDVVSYQGEHYRFANGREAYISEFASHFPHSRAELERYYDLIKKVSASSAMHTLSRSVDINVNTEYKMRSVNEVVESVISDPVLQQVLTGIQPLYAGVKDCTPFSVHALIQDCFEQSAFRIVGGSDSVAAALTQQIVENGGRVMTAEQTDKIMCDETKATGVMTAAGNYYPADLIISAIHPSRTLELIDSKMIRPFYRKRINSYSNSTSVFVVYLKFKKNQVRYMNHNLYYYRGNSVWGCEQYDDATWPKYLLYMHFCHQKDAEFAETGKILTYMNYADVAQWAGTRGGARGADYEAFKKQKAEQLIDALEEEVPHIRQYIESYYTSTPLTYNEYTGIPEGSMFGIEKDVRSIGLNSISCKTSIPNLLLTGQSITSHGMFGVLAGSMITCSQVLTQDTIFEQLRAFY